MNQTRICFVGDSGMLGHTEEALLGWPGRLGLLERANGNDVTVYNLGVRGDTSLDIRKRWRAETLARLPDSVHRAVVFSFGVNDSTFVDGERRVPLQDIINSFNEITSEARSYFQILIVGPIYISEHAQPFNIFGKKYFISNAEISKTNDILEEITSKMDFPYLELFSKLKKNDEWRREMARTDGTHPSAKGHEIIANEVGNWSGWKSIFASEQ